MNDLNVYSITVTNVILSLTSTGTYTTCGHILTRTEHLKINNFQNDVLPKSFGFIAVNRYFHIRKFKIRIRRKTRSQINQLYRNILLQQCQLEYRMMQNRYP